jgi:hypothetical protein
MTPGAHFENREIGDLAVRQEMAISRASCGMTIFTEEQ